jgi:hypothetical protein
MNDQSLSDKITALAVAGFLILTAWGNAIAMFVFALLGLILGLLFFRRSIGRGGVLAAIVGFTLAIVIALVRLPK